METARKLQAMRLGTLDCISRPERWLKRAVSFIYIYFFFQEFFSSSTKAIPLGFSSHRD